MIRETSRVVMESDGTHAGTSVWLHVVDRAGHEAKFRIPCVVTVELCLSSLNGGVQRPMLVLGLGDVTVKVHVAIGPGRSTIEDLLAEIAAARLNADKVE